MKKFLDKAKQTVKVKFLGDTVDVIKLSVAQVESFQDKVKVAKDAETEGLAIQREVIRMGVVGADELTDDELNTFPLEDLSRLAEEVLNHAGIGKAGNEKS